MGIGVQLKGVSEDFLEERLEFYKSFQVEGVVRCIFRFVYRVVGVGGVW